MEMVRNSYQEGFYTLFVFPEGDHFVGVCLELNIVEEGASHQEVTEELSDAVKTHVEAVIENKLSEDLLNRPAPREYWEMCEKFLELLRKREKADLKLREMLSPISIMRMPVGLAAMSANL